MQSPGVETNLSLVRWERAGRGEAQSGFEMKAGPGNEGIEGSIFGLILRVSETTS